LDIKKAEVFRFIDCTPTLTDKTHDDYFRQNKPLTPSGGDKHFLLGLESIAKANTPYINVTTRDTPSMSKAKSLQRWLSPDNQDKLAARNSSEERQNAGNVDYGLHSRPVSGKYISFI
jgi:hypothetical protein